MSKREKGIEMFNEVYCNDLPQPPEKGEDGFFDFMLESLFSELWGNDILTIEKVLLLNDGKDLKVGKPYVKDAKVELKVLEHRRGPKIIVYKMRPKKKTRRKNGHRQELTRVLVQSISVISKTKKSKETKDAKTTASKVESD